MATMSMSPILGGRARKITVNERVEQILQGSLQVEDARIPANVEKHEAAVARSRQLSNLYTSSMEDKFVKHRVKARSVPKPGQQTSTPSAASQQRTCRVPPIAVPNGFLPSEHSKNIVASPIKPVRCLSQQMLAQQRREDEMHSKHESPVDASPVQAKPWYKGCSSNHKLPSCTLDAKVRRYGACGTIKMMASETCAGTAPQFCLRESQSLDLIAFKNEPSAWSPSLRGSPTLWPEDSNYATGSKLGSSAMTRCPSPDFRFPTHSVGKVEEDVHFKRTKAIHAQDTNVLEQALESEKELRRQEIEYNRSKLDAWKDSLHFEPLSRKMDHPFVKLNAKRAQQVTIVHTPEYSPASNYNTHVQRLTEKRFPLRWRNMAILLDVMRRTSCRRPVLQDIEKLFALAHELAYRNANPFELSRQQYWDVMQKEYPGVEARHANRLFSSYDYRMEDRIDIRVFLGTVRALRVQQGTPIEILCLSFQDFDTTKRGVVASSDHFRAALSLCCGREAEESEMEIRANALWKKMAIDFQLYRLQEQQHDGGEHRDGISPSTTEREAFQPSEAGQYPIKYVRFALQEEKRVLAFYSEMLLMRREECFKSPIPPSR